MLLHSANTTVSSIWNLVLVSVLSKTNGKQSTTKYLTYYLLTFLSFLAANNHDVYSDLAHLLSSCTQVVSAEVPDDVREVAESIKKPVEFGKMSDEEALAWLQSGQDLDSSDKFKKLLRKHGHRGYKEFDPLVKQWAQNAIPLVKSLKASAFLCPFKPPSSLIQMLVNFVLLL